MSRKIIGVTVGSPLPKPNLMQTDPTKGDYVKGKEEFMEQINVGGNVDLTGYATEQFVRDGYQPKGDYVTRDELPDSENNSDEVYILGDGETLSDVPDGITVVIDPDGNSDFDLSKYATEGYVQEYAQPKGEYLTEVPEGYAKTEDIPTKPEDIGAQPSGNYLTEVPSGYATEEFVRNKIAEAELAGGDIDLSGYAQKSEIPTKVSQLQNDKGYLTEHQDISGKLDASALPTAISTALAQAKESGEFDGKDGRDGVDGKDGYTPQKNVDYFDGQNGSPGKDGTSATHSWNGTVLTVTSASGTSSADLKGDKGDKGDSIKGDTGSPGADGVSPTVSVSKSGKVTTVSITDKNGTKTATINDGTDGSNGKDGTSVTVKSVSESTADGGSNVVTFSDGKTVNIKNGSKGSTGADGKTPVKGTDYFTAADKAEMVNAVIAALPVYAGEVV